MSDGPTDEPTRAMPGPERYADDARRYRLDSRIATGGMGEVWRATDTVLGRPVAVKLLKHEYADDARFRTRFESEARHAGALTHAGIAGVYDFGEGTAEGSPRPFLVMELVDGQPLSALLRPQAPMDPEVAQDLLAQAADALGAAHAQGIVHRDVKPANLIVTPDRRIKVTDFGIARAADGVALTETGQVLGTPQYLSPEQARGETVDSRSDVYSTGVLLYELLTGRPPFTGDSPVAVAYQHVREPAVPPSDFDTEIPPELDAIVLKALAKPVEERYQSAAAMRNDIERYLAGRPVEAVAPPPPPPDDQPTRVGMPVPPPPVGPGDEGGGDGSGDGDGEYDDERDRGCRGGWILAGLLLLLLIAGAYFLLSNLFEDEPDRVRVPDVIGLTEKEAREQIGDARLSPGQVTYEASNDADVDEVIDQNPVGVYVAPGSTVDLTVSTGRPMVEVPFLVGQSADDAEAQLRELQLEPVLRERDDDAPENEVVELRPGAGQQVPEGSRVTVFYSDGPEQVPSVVGRSEREARRILQQAGFTVETRDLNEETNEDPGTVIEQTPAAGETADRGATVYIFVTRYERPSETPSPTESPSPTQTESPTDSPSPAESPTTGGTSPSTPANREGTPDDALPDQPQ